MAIEQSQLETATLIMAIAIRQLADTLELSEEKRPYAEQVGVACGILDGAVAFVKPLLEQVTETD